MDMEHTKENYVNRCEVKGPKGFDPMGGNIHCVSPSGSELAEISALVEIRGIVGDPKGKLMQYELVEKIRSDYQSVREWLEWWNADTTAWDGDRSEAHWNRLDEIQEKLDLIFPNTK